MLWLEKICYNAKINHEAERAKMFVDSVEIFIASGHGGAGAVSFRREKFVIQGGPDGGDGGKGGDVYFIVDRNTSTLAKFRGHKKYRAKNGMPGQPKNCHGKKGDDIYIKVPPGTQVIDIQTHEILLDLIDDGQKHKLLVGGKGGLGNAHFKNSVNQRPTYAQKGLDGQELHVRLELKLIADVALVGFPNAGKSTLISVLTNSRPKIANYEFTTLIPNLGVVDIDDFNSFVLADIPGLIEGASEGKGLGLNFLQHIERTKLLLFMIDISRLESLYATKDSNNNPCNTQNLTPIADFFTKCDDGQLDFAFIHQFSILYNEIARYSSELAQRPYAIALTKSDIAIPNQFGRFEFTHQNSKIFDTPLFLSQALQDFMQHGITIQYPRDSKTITSYATLKEPLFICPISSINHSNLNTLKTLLFESLRMQG